ncbi:MAG: hypothetical protein ACOVMM_11665 [Chitinophagaceae bacterium]
MKITSLLFANLILASFAFSQTDTIVINSANVNTKYIKPSVNRYLVYFKMSENAPRSFVQFWTRNMDTITYNNTKAYKITQSWEDKDSIMHTTKSIVDATNFSSFYHESWWKGRGSAEYNFITQKASIDNISLNDSDTAKQRKNAWNNFKQAWNNYNLNWHLDLEVFSILPYKNNVTFLIPYYDPGFAAPKNVAYTVIGSEKLLVYDNKTVDCWLLQHESKGNKELFWISKKTQEVLKLEQAFGGRYRYKIKLAYSN